MSEHEHNVDALRQSPEHSAAHNHSDDTTPPRTSAPDQVAEPIPPATSDKSAEEHLQAAHEKTTSTLSVAAVLELIPQVTKIMAILTFGVLFAFVTYNEITKDVVIIEPFEVPEELAKNGYTGQAIANKFLDQIHGIRLHAATTMQSRLFTASWLETETEMHVPEGADFLHSLLKNVKSYFGGDTIRIIGEVTLHKKQIHITTRIAGKPAQTFSGQLDALDTILRQGAEHIYYYTQPYILASYLYDQDKSRSLEVLHHILHFPPPEDDAWAYNLWGLLLFDQRDFTGAIAKYRRALAIKSASVGALVHTYNNWGLALKELGKYPEALAKYRQAIELDHKHVQVYNNWGLVLEAQGDLAGAIAKYQQAVALDPNDDTAYFYWGTALLEQGKPAEAIAKYRRVLELNPQKVQAYNNWGLALEARDDLTGALAKYQQALVLAPDDAQAHFLWGNVLFQQGDHAGAIAKYQRTLALDHTHTQASNNWGRALEGQGDFAGALAKYQQAAALAPDDVWTYFNWGNALLQQGDTAGAIAKYQKIIMLDGDNAYGYFSLGYALATQSNHAEAIGAYQKVIALDPESELTAHAREAMEKSTNALGSQGREDIP